MSSRADSLSNLAVVVERPLRLHIGFDVKYIGRFGNMDGMASSLRHGLCRVSVARFLFLFVSRVFVIKQSAEKCFEHILEFAVGINSSLEIFFNHIHSVT